MEKTLGTVGIVNVAEKKPVKLSAADGGVMVSVASPQNVVVYDIAAQHFILDNLDAIIEFENTKKENQGQPWSQEHDSCLKDLYEKGVPINEIAITLKRNSGSIRARLKKLGLSK